MANGHRVSFFAAGNDLIDCLDHELRAQTLKLVRAGSLESKPDEYSSIESVPNIGSAAASDQSQDTVYLILELIEEAEPRTVTQRNGKTRQIYDQKKNPKSVVVTLGGEVDGCILPGQLSTVSSHPVSIERFKVLARHIRKKFHRVGAYFVGPCAERRMGEGFRLTISTRAPKEYDLKEGF